MSGLFPFQRGMGVIGTNGFDSAAGNAASQIESKATSIDERAMMAGIEALRGIALTVVLRLADVISENELEDDELPSERMDALMIKGLDADGDGEVEDDLKTYLAANIADALSSLGVPDDMIGDMMGDNVDAADAAIEAAAEKIIANLPDDADLDEWSEQFIYGYDIDAGEEGEDGFDGVGKKKKKLSAGGTTIKKSKKGQTLRYKAVKAVRHGKVVLVNKRISGKVVLSAKQKGALKKAGAKAHTGSAMKRMLRSVGKGISAGIRKFGR